MLVKRYDKTVKILLLVVIFFCFIFLFKFFTGYLIRVNTDSSSGSNPSSCKPYKYCITNTQLAVRRTDCSVSYTPCNEECYSGACVSFDIDKDDLPNQWEIQYGLNVVNADSDNDVLPDSEEDLDLDKFTNLQEKVAGTNPLDKYSRPSTSKPRIVSHFGEYIHNETMSDQKWAKYLEMSLELNHLGFTHLAARWEPDSNEDSVKSRVAELRENGLKLALNYVTGDTTVLANVSREPNNHSSNNQNLRFFGAYDFNPYQCSNDCRCSNYKRDFHRTAIDPAYVGMLWQEELNITSKLTAMANFSSEDVIYLDIEIQGLFIEDALKCYPSALNDGGIYSGSMEERKVQYMLNWRRRAQDLHSAVKSESSVFLLLYNEALPSIFDLTGASVLAGTGDSANPFMYGLPTLGKLRLDLGDNCNSAYGPTFNCSRVNERNFSGDYIWINLGDANRGMNGGTSNSFYAREHLDTLVAQKAGFYLFNESVNGVLFYPEPEVYEAAGEYYIDRPYMRSASAFMRGFSGIDPGNVRFGRPEICGDDIDNNGDYYCDEGCPGVVTTTDCDGLNELIELSYGYNSQKRDTDESDGERVLTDGFEDLDGDGFLNIEEVWAGTDLSNPNTDGDNFIDGEDVCPTIYGPNLASCLSQYSAFNYSGLTIFDN